MLITDALVLLAEAIYKDTKKIKYFSIVKDDSNETYYKVQQGDKTFNVYPSGEIEFSEMFSCKDTPPFQHSEAQPSIEIYLDNIKLVSDKPSGLECKNITFILTENQDNYYLRIKKIEFQDSKIRVSNYWKSLTDLENGIDYTSSLSGNLSIPTSNFVSKWSNVPTDDSPFLDEIIYYLKNNNGGLRIKALKKDGDFYSGRITTETTEGVEKEVINFGSYLSDYTFKEGDELIGEFEIEIL